MITIKVNDIQKQIPKETTLNKLIEGLKIQTNGIAIAVNNTIIRKIEWNNQFLLEGDTILVIKSTQGG